MTKIKLENIHPELTDGFTALPRYIYRSYANGKLIRYEYLTLLYLYSIANPYGKCFVTNQDIATEVFGQKSKREYARKIMGSLKTKQYLYFDTNSGNRYKYEVTLYFFMRSENSWILPDGNRPSPQSEVVREIPRLIKSEIAEYTTKVNDLQEVFIRGTDNDTDTNNKKNKNKKNNPGMFSIKEILNQNR